jgi:hypothetical protein
MSQGIIHNMTRVAGAGNPERRELELASGEQPTLADLVVPGTGYTFSDEFARLLTVLSGERDFA